LVLQWTFKIQTNPDTAWLNIVPKLNGLKQDGYSISGPVWTFIDRPFKIRTEIQKSQILNVWYSDVHCISRDKRKTIIYLHYLKSQWNTEKVLISYSYSGYVSSKYQLVKCNASLIKDSFVYATWCTILSSLLWPLKWRLFFNQLRKYLWITDFYKQRSETNFESYIWITELYKQRSEHWPCTE
jgi:hypothetical protein